MQLLQLFVGLSQASSQPMQLVEHAPRLLLAEVSRVILRVFFAEPFFLHISLKPQLVAVSAHAADSLTVLLDRWSKLRRQFAEKL